jgi:hypothetical protein
MTALEDFVFAKGLVDVLQQSNFVLFKFLCWNLVNIYFRI